MSTAQDLIDRSLRLLEQIGAGEDPTSDESADALEAMNALIESWRNEGLMTYSMQEESLTLADGDGSYTIGASGDLNTTRPVKIEAAWIVESNISYPLTEMSEEEYIHIADKTLESDWPTRYLYRPTMTTGTLILWPFPNATRTLKLLTRVAVTGFAAVGTTVALPPGWERALATNLALEIAPEYGVQPSPDVVRSAQSSKTVLKRTNYRPLKTSTDLGLMFGVTRSRIETDQ